MGVLTDYTANKVRDVILRGTTFTTPGTVYLALFTSPTTTAGGGTEVTGGSYVRKAIAFTATSPGLATQTSDITWTGMPACVLTHIAIMTASTAGNMLIFGALLSHQTILAGQSYIADAGDVRVLFS